MKGNKTNYYLHTFITNLCLNYSLLISESEILIKDSSSLTSFLWLVSTRLSCSYYPECSSWFSPLSVSPSLYFCPFPPGSDVRPCKMRLVRPLQVCIEGWWGHKRWANRKTNMADKQMDHGDMGRLIFGSVKSEQIYKDTDIQSWINRQPENERTNRQTDKQIQWTKRQRNMDIWMMDNIWMIFGWRVVPTMNMLICGDIKIKKLFDEPLN